jgi:hypothetical protein
VTLSHRLTTAHLAPAHLQTTTDRLGESRAALEKKAELYDRLARGEVGDEGEGAQALEPSQCTDSMLPALACLLTLLALPNLCRPQPACLPARPACLPARLPLQMTSMKSTF